MFDEEDIIDELLVLFFAGSGTIQFATQMMISHFAKDPESVVRARAEI